MTAYDSNCLIPSQAGAGSVLHLNGAPSAWQVLEYIAQSDSEAPDIKETVAWSIVRKRAASLARPSAELVCACCPVKRNDYHADQIANSCGFVRSF